MYKVVIADDHPILLTGLERIINSIEGFEVIHACNNGVEAWNAVDSFQPDIVFLDLDMPEMSGLDVASKIKKKYPDISISILTLHKEESFLVRAIDLGVEGFMLKDFANVEIEKCLIALSKGTKFYSEVLKDLIHPSESLPENYSKLSRTERKVLRLISTNKTSREVAELMFLSPKTIQNHRYSISKKLALEPKNNSLLTWATKFSDSL